MKTLKSVLLCLTLLCTSHPSILFSQVSGSLSLRDGSPIRGQYVMMSSELFGKSHKYVVSDGYGKFDFSQPIPDSNAMLFLLDFNQENGFCGINFMDAVYMIDYIIYGTSGYPYIDKYMEVIGDVFPDNRVSALDVIAVSRVALGMEIGFHVKPRKVITQETNSHEKVMSEDQLIYVNNGDVKNLTVLNNGDIDGSCLSFGPRSGRVPDQVISDPYNFSVTVLNKYSVKIVLEDVSVDLGNLKLNLPDQVSLSEVDIIYGSSTLTTIYNDSEIIFFADPHKNISENEELSIILEFNQNINDFNLDQIINPKSLIRYDKINRPLVMQRILEFEVKNEHDGMISLLLNGAIDGQYIISDLSGRRISQGRINGDAKTIDMQGLKSEMLLISVLDGNQIATRKTFFTR